jgi:hypothetical protein
LLLDSNTSRLTGSADSTFLVLKALDRLPTLLTVLSPQVMGANLVTRLNKTTDRHAAHLLAACQYNTTPLHIFLMHTPFSPIDNSWLSRFVMTYDIAVGKQSVAEEAVNMVRGHIWGRRCGC